MESLKSRQITDEKKMVLRTLAKSIAEPGLKFLEVGSWLADSTLVLAKIAQEYSGHLYCVDWWKGNIDTELENIAKHHDIFSLFWKKITDHGLENVVIPIRGRSDVVHNHFKPDFFDLVFLDADHRYENVLRDIKNYSPLIKRDGGIFCGDDCEGYIADFEKKFLDQGKNKDTHETVHCGVVLAVGSTFDNYSINYNIWSVSRKPEATGWVPTDITFSDIPAKKQVPPPIFASSEHYNVFRYQKKIYAVPKDLIGFDVTDPDSYPPLGIIVKGNYEEIKRSVPELFNLTNDYPTLLSSYLNYNIVSYNNKIYALNKSLGKLDLQTIEQSKLDKHFDNHQIIIGQDEDELKELVNYYTPILILQDYNQYNIVRYKNQFYGVSQKLGPIKDWKQFSSNIPSGSLDCLVGNSVEMISNLIDQQVLIKKKFGKNN